MTAPMIAPISWAAMYALTREEVDRHGDTERRVAELGGAVGDEAERDGRVDVRARGVGDDDAGEDREAPAEGHHEEAAVEALRLREGDVGHDTATEEHEHRGAHEFGEEQHYRDCPR